MGIVEDDAVLRKSLTRLVEETRGFHCVTACASGEEAVGKLPALKPDVVLMDLNLPQMSGTDCIRRLKELFPTTQFIVLTVYEDSEHIFRALKAGASGYLLKEALNNAARHSAARHVHLRVEPHTAEVVISVEDDGHGFQSGPAEVRQGNGLPNMKQRIAQLGGRAEVQSVAGKGTTVKSHLPLAAD